MGSNCEIADRIKMQFTSKKVVPGEWLNYLYMLSVLVFHIFKIKGLQGKKSYIILSLIIWRQVSEVENSVLNLEIIKMQLC